MRSQLNLLWLHSPCTCRKDINHVKTTSTAIELNDQLCSCNRKQRQYGLLVSEQHLGLLVDQQTVLKGVPCVD